MNKQEVLAAVTSLAAEKNLTRAELLTAYTAGNREEKTTKVGVAEILSYLGGAIIAVGVAILIGQNWETLNLFAKLLSTLGVAVAAYIVGTLLMNQSSMKNVSQAFFLVSAIVFPIGIGVAFDLGGYDVGQWSVMSFITGLLFVFFTVSERLFQKNLFTLFSIIYGTAFFFALTSYAAGNGPQLRDWHFHEYRVFFAGISYILLGYSFTGTRRAALTAVLYSFGVLGFLGSALALGGYSPEQNIFWEAIFPGLVFGVIFLSIYLKSKSFLTFGALFLMGYIMKLTAEYFSDSLGWPFALVLAGLVLIGIGYVTFYLNRKYVSAALS